MPLKNRLTDYDLHLLGEGTNLRSYDRLGAHPITLDGTEGTAFAVWAPNAREVSVIGDFNGWSYQAHYLNNRGGSGIWEGFVPGVRPGARYKYSVLQQDAWTRVDKADPYGFFTETRPANASIVWDLEGYEWGDAEWMRERHKHQGHDAPMSIYEVHLGSWRRTPEGGWLTYRDLADQLAEYASDMGYTHVELMPVAEHPLDQSWGYQTLGHFAPTSRFGTPQEFMYLVDTLHRAGLGVILDWVPGHFPKDSHGLGRFDGTALYEHEDPRMGEQPDWGTYIFNFDRREVANFLLSNALFWLDKYHIDGLRVDAVASMLYRDFSRAGGEWVPNRYGGRENLEAVAFLRRFNETVYREFPDAATIAEESTAWPMVSRPVEYGGLGFGFKWNMGWMHDSLRFMARDPLYRGYHLSELTFGLLYAFHENFVLPYSHDEVVYGKGSMVRKMPGDDWQRFANLRLLYGFMYGHPGNKLLFMGSEFGQWAEWNYAQSLDWHLTDWLPHHGLQRWVRALNQLYRDEPALHELDFEPHGFEWIDCADAENVAVGFVRRARDQERQVMFVCNFTPTPRPHYSIGAPCEGTWKLVLNSDDADYGGSGYAVPQQWTARAEPKHGRDYSLDLTLPPLATLVLKPAGRSA